MNLAEISGFWRNHRAIYPVYAGIVRQFGITLEPSSDLEAPINRADAVVLERVTAWFEEADKRIEVWQLRQFLQTSSLCTEEILRMLAKRQLSRRDRNGLVRDKVDYLLVQFFAQCAAHDAHNAQVTLEHVSDLLHPVIGPVKVQQSPLYESLQKVLLDVEACESLQDLLQRRILDEARKLKEDCGQEYFEPISLLVFARFNFLMRLGFFRLMHADLHSVRHTLHELETRGIQAVDCSSAGLSSEEPLTAVRQICHEWKKPFRAAYSAGSNFRQLVDLRQALESVLKVVIANEKAVPQPVQISESPEAIPVKDEEARAATSEQRSVLAIVGSDAGTTATAASPAKIEEVEIKKVVSAGPDVTHTDNARVPDPHTSAPAPDAAKADALQACVEEIAEILISANTKSASVTNVMIHGSKQLLASWEVAAFTAGGDEISDVLQRAVAARVLVSMCKAADASHRAEVLRIADQQAAEMQVSVSQAKKAKNIDAAVNLAATAKRLLGTIEEAQKTK